MGVVCGEVFVWVGEDFSKNCHFVVELGNRVRFWQDGWYGDQPFQLAFPGLYGIAIDREASVEASLSRRGQRIEEFGMFILFGNLMIGRQMKGYIFFISSEPILLQWILETD